MIRDWLHVATEELLIVRPLQFPWVPNEWGDWRLVDPRCGGILLVRPRNIYRLTFHGRLWSNLGDERLVEVDVAATEVPSFDWTPLLQDRLGAGPMRTLLERSSSGRVVAVDGATREPLWLGRSRAA